MKQMIHLREAKKTTASSSLIVVLICGAFLLSGCDLLFPPDPSTDDSQEEQGYTGTLEVLAYGQTKEEASWLRSIAAFKEDNPDATINFTMYFEEEYHQQVAARLLAGAIPDLAYMGADARWGTPWEEAGQQVDHTPWIDADYYDLDLIPSMGPGGEIYEIPLGSSNLTTVLYMNESLVESLGFTKPSTYADLVGMVSAAQAANLEVITIDGEDGWAWGSCLMSAIIARLSGDPQWVFKAVAGENSFDDQVFIDALSLLETMAADGVLSTATLTRNYADNIAFFNDEKALFMIQGQWIARDISEEFAGEVVMMPFPAVPSEKLATKGSVAGAIQVGYGLTKKATEDADKRDAAFELLKHFHSHSETAQRLEDGVIVAPILKNFQIPDGLPVLVYQKVALAQSAVITDVIDVYLTGSANDTLNTGMQAIVGGTDTPANVASEVESLVSR